MITFKIELNAEANYRPISVLSNVVKIFEKQVHKQLIEYLKAHAFITPGSPHTNRHIWRNILPSQGYIALLIICAKI